MSLNIRFVINIKMKSVGFFKNLSKESTKCTNSEGFYRVHLKLK